MLGRTYDSQNCSAARTLEVVGERWSLLILRDVLFRGMTRFSEFQRSLGIATNILANRLEGLVENGVLERRLEGKRENSAIYGPTQRGLDLKPVIMALTEWGDRWAAPHGRPIIFRHRGCGGEMRLAMHCTVCGAFPAMDETLAVPERNVPLPRKKSACP